MSKPSPPSTDRTLVGTHSHITIILLILISVLVIWLSGPLNTPLVIKSITHSYDVDYTFTKSQMSSLSIQPSIKGISLSGEFYGAGRVYITNGTERFLIVDSHSVDEEMFHFNITEEITGQFNNTLLVGIEEEQDNSPPKFHGLYPFVVRSLEERVINLEDFFYDEDDDNLTFLVTQPEGATIDLTGSILTITQEGLDTNTTLTVIASDDEEQNTTELLLILTTSEEAIEGGPIEIVEEDDAQEGTPTPELQRREFEDYCQESCALSLDGDGYYIEVELEDGSTLHITGISYIFKKLENSPPKWREIEPIQILREQTIDLLNYAYDEEDDTLIFLVTQPENLDVTIHDSIITVISHEGYEGEQTLTVIASDGENLNSTEILIIVSNESNGAWDNTTQDSEENATNESVDEEIDINAEGLTNTTELTNNTEQLSNQTLTNETNITAQNEDEGLLNESNTTGEIDPSAIGDNNEENEETAESLTTSYPVALDEPAEWIYNVNISKEEDLLNISIPTTATDIHIYWIIDGEQREIDPSILTLYHQGAPISLARYILEQEGGEVPSEGRSGVSSVFSTELLELKNQEEQEASELNIARLKDELQQLIAENDESGRVSVTSVDGTIDKSLQIKLLQLKIQRLESLHYETPSTEELFDFEISRLHEKERSILLKLAIKDDKSLSYDLTRVRQQLNTLKLREESLKDDSSRLVSLTSKIHEANEHLAELRESYSNLEGDSRSILLQKKIDLLEQHVTALEQKRDTLRTNQRNLVTGEVTVPVESSSWLKGAIDWLGDASVTGNAVAEEGEPLPIETEYSLVIPSEYGNVVVEYQTPGPSMQELSTSSNRKTVTVSSLVDFDEVNVQASLPYETINPISIYWLVDDIEYQNLLSPVQSVDLLDVPEGFDSVEDTSYVTEDGELAYRYRLKFSPTLTDTNGNNIPDAIQWIVPHLSNQTYEIIIEITNALHLDENGAFISNLYDVVKEKDNIWSETIADGEYVRVTFEHNLTNKRDITIYPRTISGTPQVEIYEAEGSQLIAEFVGIQDNTYSKVHLTGLEETQNTFDLKITGGSMQFDHIIDPLTLNVTEDLLPTSILENIPTNVTIYGSIKWDNGSSTTSSELKIYFNGSDISSSGVYMSRNNYLAEGGSVIEWWNSRSYRKQIWINETAGLARTYEHVRINVSIPENRLRNQNRTAFVCDGEMLPFDGYAVSTSNGWVTQLVGLVEINLTANQNKSCYLYYAPEDETNESLSFKETGWHYVGNTTGSNSNPPDDLTLASYACSGTDAEGKFDHNACNGGTSGVINEWCYFKGQQTGSETFRIQSADQTGMLSVEGTAVVTGSSGSGTVSTIIGRYYKLEADVSDICCGPSVYPRYGSTAQDIDTECYGFLGDEWLVNYGISSTEEVVSLGGYNYTILVNALAGDYTVLVNVTDSGVTNISTQTLSVNATTNTYLNAPADNTTSGNATWMFNCSAINSNGLNNITFYWNYSGTWEANGTVSLLGTSNSTVFSRDVPDPKEDVVWNCMAGGSSTTDFADTNLSFNVRHMYLTETVVPSSVLETLPVNITVYGHVNMSNGDNVTYANVSIYRNNTFINSTIANSTGDYNYTFLGTFTGGDNLITASSISTGISGNTSQILVVNATTVTTLNSPNDHTITSNNTLTFNCSATNSAGLSNITFYWNYGGTWEANGSTDISGSSGSALFTRDVSETNENVIWNCVAVGNGVSDSGDSNWTVTIRRVTVTETLSPSSSTELTPTNITVYGHINSSDGLTLIDWPINIYFNASLQNTSIVDSPQWATGSKYRKKVTITNNNNSVAMEANYTINISVNTQTLISAGKMLANGSDFRVLFFNGTAYTEIDRINTTVFNLANTQILFKTQDVIRAGSSTNSTSEYWIAYGGVSGNIKENASNVYILYDDFNDGTLSGWTVGRGTWTEGGGGINITNDTSYLWQDFSAALPIQIDTTLRLLSLSSWQDPGVGVTNSSTGGYIAVLTSDNIQRINEILDGGRQPCCSSYGNWGSSTTVWRNISMRVWADNNYTMLVSGSVVGTYSDITYQKPSRITIYHQTYGSANKRTTFDIIKVYRHFTTPSSTLGTELVAMTDVNGDYNYTLQVSAPVGVYPVVVNVTYNTLVGNNTQSLTMTGVTTTSLNSPVSNTSTSNTSVMFNCSATNGEGLNNITFYWNYSGVWEANGSVDVSGTSTSTSFTRNVPDTKENVIWNCLAVGSGTNDFANANSTINIRRITLTESLAPTSILENTASTVIVYGRINMSDNTNLTGVNASIYLNSTFVNNTLLDSEHNYNYTMTVNIATGIHPVVVNLSTNTIIGNNTQYLTVNTTTVTSLNSPQDNLRSSSSQITFNCSEICCK